MRGAASYVPLVGIPAPVSLHEEDACFQRLLLSALGVRSTAERVSLLAASHIGGLGAPSVVETLVASCASDLITLLSGSSTASLVARDSLRHALLLPPQQAEDWDGLVVRGMRFLSGYGYGFHITVSTDRFVGRVLDLLAAHSAHPHALLGPFDPAVFSASQRFCRVGLRAVFAQFRRASLPSCAWGDVAQWAPHVPVDCGFALADLARATGSALANAVQEWRAECAFFRPDVPPPPLPPDWPDCAWEDPWCDSADPRSQHLDPIAAHEAPHGDFAIFGDGSALPSGASSFCAQARGLGSEAGYWDSNPYVTSRIAARLPQQFGSGASSVHVAELVFIVGRSSLVPSRLVEPTSVR